MARTHILVDTNTYLRLARSIRPLLGLEFGEAPYCLTIIPGLNGELTGRRLLSKFPWVEEAEYVAERGYFPQLSKLQTKNIARGFDVIWDYVTSDFPGPSRVDVRYIAYASELECALVTDDVKMAELADAFAVPVMPTLALLKLMLDCGHTTKSSIDALLDYWRYVDDVPANFEKDRSLIFGA